VDGDDGVRELRARVDELESALERIEAGDLACGAAKVVRTVSLGSYPTGSGVNRVFAVRDVVVSGTETEGATATSTVDTRTFYAVNVGTGIPPVGTDLIAVQVPHVWAFRYP
jgi:hypothetical protein